MLLYHLDCGDFSLIVFGRKVALSFHVGQCKHTKALLLFYYIHAIYRYLLIHYAAIDATDGLIVPFFSLCASLDSAWLYSQPLVLYSCARRLYLLHIRVLAGTASHAVFQTRSTKSNALSSNDSEISYRSVDFSASRLGVVLHIHHTSNYQSSALSIPTITHSALFQATLHSLKSLTRLHE